MRRTRVSRRALLAAVLAIAMCAPAYVASAAQWEPSILRSGEANRFALIEPGRSGNRVRSQINIQRPAASGNGRVSYTVCQQFGEPPCDFATAKARNLSFSATLLLPDCSTNLSTFCVESLSVYREGSAAESATYLGATRGPIVEPKPDVGLLYGGGTLLYNTAVPHTGGTTTYSVKAVLGLQSSAEAGKFQYGSFSVSIDPYTQREVRGAGLKLLRANPGTRLADSIREDARIVGENEWLTSGNSGSAWTSDDVVGTAEDFTLDVRARLTVRIPADAGGWFSGRIKDPQLSLQPVSTAINRLTIDAKALSVPRMDAIVPWSEMTEDMKSAGITPGVNRSIEATSSQAFDWLTQLSKFVRDQAAGTTVDWMLTSTHPLGRSCFNNQKISGIITTNATAYSASPPDMKDGFLDYKVGGLHLMPDGSVTQGTYDLILSSEVARCIYGFSDAPISATISIVGEGGESRSVATTVVSEKDGWLKLAAYGFTFSSPTVRVKLTQPEMTPVVTPKKPVKKTIVCVKGKVTKRVTAANPKCPSGFRKR